MILDCKYVLHLPLSRWENGSLIPLDVDELLDELILNLEVKGFDSFYVTKVESYYKSRKFDGLLLTVFASGEGCVEEIFRDWFLKNNDVLAQEAFAYEKGNKMIIETLKR